MFILNDNISNLDILNNVKDIMIYIHICERVYIKFNLNKTIMFYLKTLIIFIYKFIFDLNLIIYIKYIIG